NGTKLAGLKNLSRVEAELNKKLIKIRVATLCIAHCGASEYLESLRFFANFTTYSKRLAVLSATSPSCKPLAIS
ncbi:MAG: hypothetical protein KKC03_07715, partial [Bacteroidetes bacterium]|nr:hypothetical protein [Bacteroidota bacterium]